MTATKDIAVMRIGDDGCARFTFGNLPQVISGRRRVAAHFIQTLLTRPGSIFTSPTYGGGLLQTAENGVVSDSELDAAVASAVSKAVRDVLVEQNQHPTEPADRLANVTTLEARFDRLLHTYFLKFEIRTETGESEIVSL